MEVQLLLLNLFVQWLVKSEHTFAVYVLFQEALEMVCKTKHIQIGSLTFSAQTGEQSCDPETVYETEGSCPHTTCTNSETVTFTVQSISTLKMSSLVA